MSMPVRSLVSQASTLSFDGIVGAISKAANDFKDKRIGTNTQYLMKDFVLSAFSVFYLQSPSFLAYQQAMEKTKGNNNARTLFGISKIPTDNQTRVLLDENEPDALFPVFDAIFNGLENDGLLEQFKSSRQDLLIAFDGLEYHNSKTIHCPQCKTKQHQKSGEMEYSHGMVTAVLVKPGCPHVIDLPPEFIVPQDGHQKQDCENAAAKRWLARHAQRYRSYGVTILGDDLYSRQPLCEAVLEAGFHFIFNCKPSSHKTLYEWIEGVQIASQIQILEVQRWTGKRHETDRYSYTNQVALRDGEDALMVNWCDLVTTDDKGKVLYHNSFVTDHVIDSHTVIDIVSEGRSRWKTENENNLTLKKHGYHLEHNFGHGNKNLCNLLATFNMLAFLTHTVLAMVSDIYQKLRKALGARRRLFEHLRTLSEYKLFSNWEAMMRFMAKNLEIKLNSS